MLSTRCRLRISQIRIIKGWRDVDTVALWTENPFSEAVQYITDEVDDWEIFNNHYVIELKFADGTYHVCESPADFAVASYWTLVDWHDGRGLYALLSRHPVRPSPYGGHPIHYYRDEREVISLMRYMRDHIMTTPEGVRP